MHQRIRMPQVVQELIPQPLAFVRARHQPRHIEQLDGDGPTPVDAAAVVGFAAAGEVGEAGARARDLQVADGALGVDGGEAGKRI